MIRQDGKDVSFAAELPPVLPVSLVLVSDYEDGAKTWNDERKAVAAYLNDPHGIPAEVVIVGARADIEDAEPPSEWSNAPVPVRVEAVDETASGRMKNCAVALSNHEIVAVIETDCIGEQGWLAIMMRRMQEDPQLGMLSPRTAYPAHRTDRVQRVMTLLDRGYVEVPEADGRMIFRTPINGGLERRSLALQFPYPHHPSPFIANHLREMDIHKAGVAVGLEPSAVLLHAFHGFGFIADLRRNKGFQFWHMMRRENPDRWDRLGGASQIRKVVRQAWKLERNVIRRLGPKRLKPLDWPLVPVMVLLGLYLAAQGAADARAGAGLPRGSGYR